MSFTQRAWGARPALTPGDVPSQLLLWYLRAGEHDVTRVMAQALARSRAQTEPIRWAAPSFSQLLIGYAYALSADAPALAAWCRRTDAARFLGTDGVILTAHSAWERNDRHGAARLLVQAGEMAPPVVGFGLEIGVRLAFLLAGNRARQVTFDSLEGLGEALARLVTNYGRLSTKSDPEAITVTTLTSTRRSASLAGRAWRHRAAWAAIYVLTSIAYRQSLNASKGLTSLRVKLGRLRGERPPFHDNAKGAIVTEATKDAVSDTWVAVERRRPGGRETLVGVLAVGLLIAWLAVMGVAIVLAWKGSQLAWERILTPLAVVQCGLFLLLGVVITMVAIGKRAEELTLRAQASEARALALEEEAMKGRALAAALQAEGATAVRDGVITQHARMSRALFGDLLGREHIQQSEVTISSSPPAS